MPTFASPIDLQNHLGETRYADLTDRDADGMVDETGVEQALEDASSKAASYCARWLPISVVPPSLRGAVCDLATYDLAGDKATDEERRKAELALAWLRDVAKGLATLGLDPQPSKPSVTGPRIEADPALFTRRQTRGLL
jgi:phage gp36-like protein